MPEVTVTLVEYYKADGTTARGAWQRHDFKDADNQKYQTFEAALANRAYGLLNQPAVLTYEDVTRGEYTNRVIKGISPVEAPQAVTEAPVASDDVFNPQATPEPTDDELAKVGLAHSKKLSENELRQVQIMRQSALERAIRWIGLDGDPDKGLYGLSEEFLHYFQTGEYPGKPTNEQDVLAEFASQFPDAA